MTRDPKGEPARRLLTRKVVKPPFRPHVYATLKARNVLNKPRGFHFKSLLDSVLNRPFAEHGLVTLSIIKIGGSAYKWLPEMERA